MSRRERVDRFAPDLTFGALSAPEWATSGDRRLSPNLSVNGKPPEIATGDEQLRYMQVRCWCGQVVAVVSRIDRTARGMAPLDVIERQVVADRDARPVRAAILDARLRDLAEVECDCAVHGRHVVRIDRLVELARRNLPRVLDGSRATMVKYMIPRVSQ